MPPVIHNNLFYNKAGDLVYFDNLELDEQLDVILRIINDLYVINYKFLNNKGNNVKFKDVIQNDNYNDYLVDMIYRETYSTNMKIKRVIINLIFEFRLKIK